MVKLKELAALLINEFNDFNKGIKKLEKINAQLEETKIKMDLTEYKVVIENQQQQMASYENAIERFEKRFDNEMKMAKIYPTWAVVIFAFCITVTVTLSSYLLFK